MATAVSQLKIQLQGAQTIEQLEETLDQVNNQIKQVDINSQAFKDLSKVAQEADGQLRGVQGSLEGVTGQEQAESAKKLGEGLAGAFAAATVASSVFGEDTAESVQEATNTALQLVVVLDGLEKASQAFSSETVKGLRSIVTGFRSSTAASALFGTTTRAALTATGIGALVIGIGLLIANWEAVTDAAKSFGSAVIDTVSVIFPPFQSFAESVGNLVDRVGSLGNLFSALGSGIAGAFSVGKNAADEFTNSLDQGRVAEKLAESIEETAKFSELLSEQFRFFKIQLEQIDNENANIISSLERQIDLATNQFEKAQAQRELQTALLEIEAEKAESAQKFLDLSEENITNAITQQEANKVALKDQLDQIDNQEDLIAKVKEINDIEENIVSLEESRIFIQELINSGIQTQDQLTKSIADNERSRSTELERLNKLLQEGLKTIRQQNEAQDKEKLEEAVEEVRKLVEGFDDANDAASKLNKELDDFLASGEGDPPDEQIDRLNLSLAEAIRLQQALNREANKLPNEYENANDQIEDFQRKASEVIVFIGQQVIDSLQAPITFIQGNIQSLENDLSRISALAEESTERRTELEEDLENAQGKRFDQILVALRQEKERERELTQQRLDQEAAIAEARTNQAKLEKAQAIAQATVQTLLSVVEALPNIPLSVLVGAIGAANIAAIGSQPIPEFAEGGYTGDGMAFRDSSGERVAGVVHENEYVIPKHIVSSNPDMVATLEAMRTGKKGFAQGGLVPQVSQSSSGINSNQLVNALRGARFQVSVNEFRDVSTEVDVIEQNSSL